MKKVLTVTILFCLIILSFVVPSFASHLDAPDTFTGQPLSNDDLLLDYNGLGNLHDLRFVSSNNGSDVYSFSYSENGAYAYIKFASVSSGTKVTYKRLAGSSYESYTINLDSYNSSNNLYYNSSYVGNAFYNDSISYYVPFFSNFYDGFSSLRNYIDNPPPAYSKNPNVDEFIANTLISMGYTFQNSSSALSFASLAWDYCIDDDNIGTNGYTWDIENFVSYCNAQSNNYTNWFNGYRVSSDVVKALKSFSVYQNNTNYPNLPSGVALFNERYSYHGGRGSVSAEQFYIAQTYTYFNGTFVHDNNVIDLDQFLYSPADVRRFLAYPSSPAVTYDPDPDGNSGSGTLTDDGNGGFDLDINFPSFEWLADAIQSLLDFLNQLVTTVSNFLSKIIDTLESLFSDAFESLSEFGQGFLDFIQGVWDGTVTLGNGVLPSSLWSVIQPFLMLAIGIGLLKFILRAH